jgi:uncharacterized protein (TIGR02594 family)
MPYVYRPYPQAVDTIDKGVIDVYHSNDCYVNSVPVALWQPPGANGGIGAVNVAPDPPVSDYAPNPEQRANAVQSIDGSYSNPEEVFNVGGGESGPGTMAGGGDMPGTNTSDANDLTGNPEAGAAAISGSGTWTAVYNYIQRTLNEAAGGQWKEIGKKGCCSCPANPKIIYTFQQMGFTRQSVEKAVNYQWCGDQIPWCAAFVGTVLKDCGAPYVKGNLSAKAYDSSKWGARPIGRTNYDQWRLYDVLVKKSGNFNHVGFVAKVDPRSNRFLLFGGNQSNNVTLGVYKDLGNVYNVYRWAEVPAEYDKSIVGDVSGAAGGSTR